MSTELLFRDELSLVGLDDEVESTLEMLDEMTSKLLFSDEISLVGVDDEISSIEPDEVFTSVLTFEVDSDVVDVFCDELVFLLQPARSRPVVRTNNNKFFFFMFLLHIFFTNE